MDFVKFYITQAVKSASTRLRLIDKEKEKTISRLISKLENSTDIFPDLKTMERVKGLEEISKRLLNIYRRLNKAHIDLERISYQFGDDRDAIASMLRRFVQGVSTLRSPNKSSRPKIVFDDTTFTFYELKEAEKVESEEIEEEIPIEEEKLELDEFLSKDQKSLIEVASDSVILDDKTEHEILKETINSRQDGFPSDSIDRTIENYPVTTDGKEEIDSKAFELVKKENDKEIPASPNLEFEFGSGEKEVPIGEKIEDKSERKAEQEETVSDDSESEKTISQKEFVLREELMTQEEKLFQRGKKDESGESHEKTEEEIYIEFENELIENVKKLDEYLATLNIGAADEKKEEEIISQAYNCYQSAEKLGHDVLAKMIKTYWTSLLAIRDRKLPSTRNEAELIRSTLIIIVALVKNKDIDLQAYWENHNYLVSKLQNLSYEV